VAEMRAQYGMAHRPLTSLLEAAREQNLRLKDVAERLGIGVPIVSKLEQRLLQFTTLPETLIQKLAETLDTAAENVRDYLRQPPTLAAGAAYQYTGKATPQVQAQQDFAEAIRTCPGMSEADKQVWLAEIEA
jgi:transcriptional regulator with XRE-family HTH domain